MLCSFREKEEEQEEEGAGKTPRNRVGVSILLEFVRELPVGGGRLALRHYGLWRFGTIAATSSLGDALEGASPLPGRRGRPARLLPWTMQRYRRS